MTILLGSILGTLPAAFAVGSEVDLTISPTSAATGDSSGLDIKLTISAPSGSFGANSRVEFVIADSSDPSDITLPCGGSCEDGAVDGDSDDTDARATSSGKITSDTTIVFDIAALDAGTYYVFATDDEGDTWSNEAELEIIDQDDAPSIEEVDEGPEAPLEVNSDADITISGTGFTADGSVTVYLDYVGGDKVTSFSADADGDFEEIITLPELADADYELYFHDEDADIAAISDDTLDDDFDDDHFDIDVDPSVTYSVTSLVGDEDESVKITGRGFAADETIDASEDDADSIEIDTIATTHDEVEISSDGSFTVTVTLDTDLPAASIGTSADVAFTYADEDAPTCGGNAEADETCLDGSLPVSDPTVVGDETLSLDVAVGDIDDEVVATIFNFPDKEDVTISLGSNELGTAVTDSNGYATFTGIVPATPAGGYVIIAHLADPGISVAEDFTVEASWTLKDSDGDDIATDTYIESGDEITVAIYGLQPFEEVEIDDDTYDSADETMDAGAADGVGTLTHTYTTDFDSDEAETEDTGDSSTITIDPATTVAGSFTDDDVTGAYLILLDPAFEATGDLSGYLTSELVSGNDLTIEAGDISLLKASTEYNFQLNGADQKVEVDGEVESEFTSTSAGLNPELEFNFKSSTDEGVNSLELLDEDDNLLLTIRVIVSDPGEDAEIVFSEDTTNSPDDTAHVTSQTDGMDIIIFNLDEDQADISVTMATSGGASVGNLAENDDADGNGVLILEDVDIPATAGGVYAVEVVDADEAGIDVSLSIEVHPTILMDDDDEDDDTEITVEVGETVNVEPHALAANTWYVLWLGHDDDLAGGEEIDDTLFRTDDNGAIDADEGGDAVADADADGADHVAITVPNKSEGTYNISAAPAADKTPVKLEAPDDYTQSTLEIDFSITVTPSDGAYPQQAVEVEWDTGSADVDSGTTIDALVIELDGAILTTLGDDDFTIAQSDDDTDVVTALFLMPNGDVADDLELSVSIKLGNGTSVASETVVIDRIAGSGALEIDTDENADIATIKTDVGLIKTTVDEMDASIVSIDGDVALVKTSVGSVATTVSGINAKITTVENGFVTITSDIGLATIAMQDAVDFAEKQLPELSALVSSTASSVQTEIANTRNEIVGLKSDISVLSDNVGTAIQVSADGKALSSSINTGVQGIASGVSTLQSDVSALSADVSSTNSQVEGINSGVTQSTTSILIVVILTIVTVIMTGATLVRRQS
jgi:peptidoglycan hydrolase CwlO-like protein